MRVTPASRPLHKGIDFDGLYQRMMKRIALHTEGSDDAFWAYFYKRRNATTGMRCDDQLLLSSFVNQVRELLEAKDDAQGLEWLDQLENECFCGRAKDDAYASASTGRVSATDTQSTWVS